MNELRKLHAILDGWRRVAFTNRPEVSTHEVQGYATVLQRYSLDRINDAIRLHMADPERGRFFPKPADIVHQCRLHAPRPERVSVDEVLPQLPAPEPEPNAPRITELTEQAAARYRSIMDQTEGSRSDKQAAATAAWKADMRAGDPNWGRDKGRRWP